MGRAYLRYNFTFTFISFLATLVKSEDGGASMKILYPAKLQRWNCTYGLGTGALNIQCGIYRHLQWTLQDFRVWTDAQEFDGIKLHLKCFNAGSISVRQPVGARKLKALTIENCMIYNHFDYEISNYTENLQNELRVLRYFNSVFKTNINFMIKHILQWEKMAKVAKCYVPESVEYVSISGTSEIDIESLSVENLTLAQQMHEEFLKFRRQNLCHYRYLKTFEYRDVEGNNKGTLDNVFKFGEFPELVSLIITGLKLMEVPTQLTEREWYLRFPKVKKIDISRNLISEMPFDNTPSSHAISINMSNNKISTLTKNDFKNLRSIYPSTIDLSSNEIKCSCTEDFSNFLDFIGDGDYSENWKQSYRYLREEKCFQPRKYQGIPLKSFDISSDCSTETDPILNDRNVIILICLLSVTFSLTCVSVTLKFRNEIKILTFTRLKVKLGRSSRQNWLIKEYDAFVSYSHLDEKWVNDSLCKHLENSPPYFRLCLHHKHFVPGACISDNIIESVEKSRHTIIVLSDNFLQSEWCILEFRKAFHQSLLERTRHLIVILLDEINQENLEPDMKHFLKTHTYLKRSEYIFWDKLIYTLSDKRRVPYSRSSSSSSATYDVKLSMDKCDLTIPTDTALVCNQ